MRPWWMEERSRWRLRERGWWLERQTGKLRLRFVEIPDVAAVAGAGLEDMRRRLAESGRREDELGQRECHSRYGRATTSSLRVCFDSRVKGQDQRPRRGSWGCVLGK